ncbi:acyl carrier protein [Candidatus Gromoviella agglomerans]|uniref:acyl carrier protein n=1 Tax=Candidatus Gromoviella agglomerans TaxID=2806609 RepID=UPI001E3641EE|nr:acyl carrier protein [Candidatus Gromoviella agglomerans]UFX98217.1 Acyl carrier protein [Candidatus Gromoviella agglomerans]
MNPCAYSEEDIKAKVIEIVRSKLSVDPGVNISDDTNFVNDLGADSLDSVELIMEIEKSFDIEIGDEIAKNITSIKGTIDAISSRLSEKNAT